LDRSAGALGLQLTGVVSESRGSDGSGRQGQRPAPIAIWRSGE
jgi:hypothetical protein